MREYEGFVSSDRPRFPPAKDLELGEEGRYWLQRRFEIGRNDVVGLRGALGGRVVVVRGGSVVSVKSVDSDVVGVVGG